MIKIGIIGIGKWGQNHLKSLAQLPCTLSGIADTDPNRKTLADQFHTLFYHNYHDLLPEVPCSDGSVDPAPVPSLVRSGFLERFTWLRGMHQIPVTIGLDGLHKCISHTD